MAADNDTAGQTRALQETYLADHFAASAGGEALAGRLAAGTQDETLRAVVGEIRAEIHEERRALTDVFAQLEFRPNRVKELAAKAATALGMLKLNGRLVRRSPLSDVLEIEGLRSGVEAKRLLWFSVGNILGADAPILGGRWTAGSLRDQAKSQSRRLADEHRRAVSRAFGGVAAPDGAPEPTS